MHRGATPDATRQQQALRTHRVFVVIAFMASVAVAVHYAVDPDGWGGPTYVTVCAILTLVSAVAPMARGARPRRVWAPQVFASLCLLASLVALVTGGGIGPFAYTDITYFSAYVGLVTWLTRLGRVGGGAGHRMSVIDATAAATGALLVVWSVGIAPVVGGALLPEALVASVYPTADMLVLVVCVHLARRVQVITFPLAGVIVTFAGLVVLDALVSMLRILTHEPDPPVLTALYVFWFFGLAISAAHPGVATMARLRVTAEELPSRRPRTILVLLTIPPVVLSTACPVTGLTDIIVRIGLITVLLALLFLRLTLTMKALWFAEAESRHRATRDGLTKLLNRRAMLDHLANLVARNAADGRFTAVLFLDCDDFKLVNDTWGHDAGDGLLTQVAVGLPTRLRPDDVLARHGGDEFVVLATVSGPGEALELAQVVQDFFAEPLAIVPGRTHVVTSSVGIAVAAPTEHVSPQELLSRADIAMYAAKQSGRGRCAVYADSLDRASRIRAAVGARLGAAIRADAIDIALQPIMGGDDYDRLVAWEALARWHDPELGEVAPDVFVSVAEQLGLIGELGEVVLRRACRELVALRRSMGRDDLMICVNVSPTQLLQPGFVHVVRSACRSAGLTGDGLCLEVTETLLVDNGPSVLDTLHELRRAGVGIHIDDFGTGYASLSTLLRLPVDCVKIDRSLVARVGVDADAVRQLTAVIDLVRSLGISLVVAEGVETLDQEAALRELGCPMVQGWLYGRPARPEAILASLRPAPAERG